MDTMQELFKRYPDVVNELYRQVVDYDLDCADNYRVAKLDDSYDRVVYDKVASNGCCGVFERVVTVNGEQFKIGCNYGH